MAEFHKVAQLSDLGPGKIKATQLGSDFVAVTQVSGKVYAFDDTCPHAACSMADGEIDGDVITCVCHGREFSISTGKPVNPPFGDPMKLYPVKVEGNDVLVEK
jgi:nitrite reductase/ring-hydroxylating ferredoxin subunit